ncbi:hypothetical protein Slin15195_G057850 [Septoria linicola]|uniref:Uncharacterized protein n=1 Tax=Septoria linicola TaxID=215465 RepID=A0A9Q9AXI6_9PEZI|nr:hypothetical protein Slin14017_G073700 [Septoria linicola]USW52466.1 hypothetical protein Slin15195_G057850 [Septoria linicola]
MSNIFGHSGIWQRFLEETVYHAAESPSRRRKRPMQVICPGFPRSATESLQNALIILGYDYTYHGWDLLLEQPQYPQAWIRLCKKKWYGSGDGESNITAADFDAVLGHSVAVTDAAASVFAAELIAAYPEALVVLNYRRDLDAWHQSCIQHIAGTNEDWYMWWTSWWTWYGFWSWSTYERYMWPLLFRATDGANLSTAIRRNGKWIYRDHCNMIRGPVPEARLLEWTVDDGWEPLCKFLGKAVPDVPFPSTNNAAGFQQRAQQWLAMIRRIYIRNLSIFVAVCAAGLGAFAWKYTPARPYKLNHILS